MGGKSDDPKLELTLSNHTARTQTVRVRGLDNADHRFELATHARTVVMLDPLVSHHGWYDLVVTVERAPVYRRQFAGHLENSQPSRTGPD